MRIDVISLFPEMVEEVLSFGIPRRAAELGALELKCWNPRDYARDNHRTVDDRPYGGGPGMVMRMEPLRSTIAAARADGNQAPLVYVSPQGRRLEQRVLNELAGRSRVIFLAGRYEGIDERLIETEVDDEISIGDYVLSGGELAVMVMVDGISRLLPGVLGAEQSARQDSFMDGLLDFPHYTRPEVLDGLTVPETLLSGHHEDIRRWRRKQALGRTWLRRPDLLRELHLNREQEALLEEFITEHRQYGRKTPAGSARAERGELK